MVIFGLLFLEVFKNSLIKFINEKKLLQFSQLYVVSVDPIKVIVTTPPKPPVTLTVAYQPRSPLYFSKKVIFQTENNT